MNVLRAHAVLGLAVVAFATTNAMAFRSGPPSGRTGSIASGGSSCTDCHGATVGNGTVEILGAPAGYELGATYDLTVRVSDPDQAGAGFQISVEDAVGTHVGTLSLIDATGTQLNTSDYVNHTSTGVDNAVSAWAGNGNSADYPVRWQAPASDVGPITFWAAGNAINNNFSSSGDRIYLTNETVNMAEPIPAASTWGLVVMTITLLAVGTIVVVRQKPRPLPVRQHR